MPTDTRLMPDRIDFGMSVCTSLWNSYLMNDKSMFSGTFSWCDEPVKRGRIGEVLAPAQPVLALRSALFAPAVLNVDAALRGLICYRTWK